MYDPAAKNLVWRGTASKTLDPKAKPEKRRKELAEGCRQALEELPSSAKEDLTAGIPRREAAPALVEEP